MQREFQTILVVALLRTITSAILGFAIDIFIRLSGASNITMGIVYAVPSLVYMVAAVGQGANSDRVGRRKTILISSAISVIATVAYSGMFYIVGSLTLLIVAAVVIQTMEGAFTGGFWPILQSNLDASDSKNNKELRVYNLSWNAGLIIGNTTLLFVTGISADPAILFPFIHALTIWCVVGESAIFLLLAVGFQRTVSNSAVKVSATQPASVIPANQPMSGKNGPTFGIITFVLIAVLVFAINVGGILTNVFNQLTEYSEMPALAVNLLPWIVITDNARQMSQMGATSTFKPKQGSVQQLALIIGLMGLLTLPIAIASIEVTHGGALFLAIFMAVNGILSGMVYNVTMQVIMHDSPATKKGYYQGLYEAILSLGFFIGPIVVAAISQVQGYLAAYSVLASLTLLCAFYLGAISHGTSFIPDLPFTRWEGISSIYMGSCSRIAGFLTIPVPRNTGLIPSVVQVATGERSVQIINGNPAVEVDLWPAYAIRLIERDQTALQH